MDYIDAGDDIAFNYCATACAEGEKLNELGDCWEKLRDAHSDLQDELALLKGEVDGPSDAYDAVADLLDCYDEDRRVDVATTLMAVLVNGVNKLSENKNILGVIRNGFCVHKAVAHDDAGDWKANSFVCLKSGEEI